MTDTDMLYMAALEKRLETAEAENTELKARIAELEDKHWSECRQIARYEDELSKYQKEMPKNETVENDRKKRQWSDFISAISDAIK